MATIRLGAGRREIVVDGTVYPLESDTGRFAMRTIKDALEVANPQPRPRRRRRPHKETPDAPR